MGRYADSFTGQHIYIPIDISPGRWFAVLVGIHGTEEEFFELQHWVHNLVKSITSAQIEIVLQRCLLKVQEDLERTHLQLLAASKERHRQAQDSNIISFNLSPSLQLSTTQGPVATYVDLKSTATDLLKAGNLLTALAEGAATRFLKLLQAACFTPLNWAIQIFTTTPH